MGFLASWQDCNRDMLNLATMISLPREGCTLTWVALPSEASATLASPEADPSSHFVLALHSVVGLSIVSKMEQQDGRPHSSCSADVVGSSNGISAVIFLLFGQQTKGFSVITLDFWSRRKVDLVTGFAHVERLHEHADHWHGSPKPPLPRSMP